MLRFIYLLTRTIHPVTTAFACICFYLAASTSDFYVTELGQTEPESVQMLITFGLVMLIPCVIYSALNLLLEIARIRVRAKKGAKKHNAIHR